MALGIVYVKHVISIKKKTWEIFFLISKTFVLDFWYH